MLLSKERVPTQHVITCEDKFITLILEKVKTLRGLVSLASEIFLLSNKQKYNPETHQN